MKRAGSPPTKEYSTSAQLGLESLPPAELKALEAATAKKRIASLKLLRPKGRRR